MRTRVALAVLAAALTVAPPAAVGAVSAVPVSGRTIEARPVTLGFDASGRAVASWAGLRGPSADETRPFAGLATATSPVDAWRAAPRLPRTVFDHAVAVARGPVAAIITLQQEPAGRRRSRTLVVLRLWDTRSARFGRRVRLYRGPAVRISFEGPSPTAFSPRIGMTDDGDVVVTWLRTDTRKAAGIWTAELRPDGRLVRPHRLAGRRAGYPQLRIAPDGTGLLVWSRDRLIQARHRSAGGRWGAVESVGSAPGWVTGLEDWQIAGAGDRFVLAGVVTNRGGGGVRTQVFADQRAPGGHWSGTALGEYVFHTTGATSYVTDHLRAVPLVAADGRALVAWPDLTDDRMRAALTTLGTPGAPLLLSAPGADVAIDDAAVRPDGTTAVTWFDGTTNLAQVDRLGTVAVTPALADERALLGSRVAFDPRSGRATVLWAQGSSERGYRIVSWTAP